MENNLKAFKEIGLINPDEIMIHGKTLREVLDRHSHYLCKDVAGWEKMKADFKGVEFVNVDFRGENLSEINFEDSNLKNCNFTGARMDSVSFDEETFLQNCKFDRCSFKNVSFGGTKVERSTFLACTFENAVLNESFWTDSVITSSRLVHTNLNYTVFIAATFKDVQLKECDFIRTEFDSTLLADVDFGKSFMCLPKIENSIIKNCMMEDAKNFGLACERTEISNTKLPQDLLSVNPNTLNKNSNNRKMFK